MLHRHQSGELACDIPLVISNHEDCRAVTEFYGVPFHVISVNKDNKAEAEAAQQALLRANQIDLIVLARYMQVLSHDFTAQWPQRVINIHHSFFAGLRRRQALPPCLCPRRQTDRRHQPLRDRNPRRRPYY